MSALTLNQLDSVSGGVFSGEIHDNGAVYSYSTPQFGIGYGITIKSNNGKRVDLGMDGLYDALRDTGFKASEIQVLGLKMMCPVKVNLTKREESMLRYVARKELS